MENLEERLENEDFHEISMPSDEDATIYPYAFLIEDAILIAKVDEKEQDDES